MSRIASNLKRVQETIAQSAEKAGRNPGDVRLVCVTKTAGVDEIRELYDLGQRLMGESRIQHARDKIAQLTSLDIQWHMIGHLQRNKVKTALELFQMIHSVDSLKLACEISRRAETLETSIPVLLEVNISGEESKFGVAASSLEDDLMTLVEEMGRLPRLVLQGLMTMAPFELEAEATRPIFRRLRELKDTINERGIVHQPLSELSMGMTNDYAIAVEEGATLVRVGSALFE